MLVGSPLGFRFDKPASSTSSQSPLSVRIGQMVLGLDELLKIFLNGFGLGFLVVMQVVVIVVHVLILVLELLEIVNIFSLFHSD